MQLQRRACAWNQRETRGPLLTQANPSKPVLATISATVAPESSSVPQTSTAEEGGFYTVPNLPGDYEVTATAPDFATKVETGITLNVGGHQQLNITLQVGTVTQTILVSSGNSSCSEVNLVIGRRSRSS